MIEFDYIKCPLNKYTFKVKNIREWVEEDAAEAYNKKALELHGEFAFLNKIF